MAMETSTYLGFGGERIPRITTDDFSHHGFSHGFSKVHPLMMFFFWVGSTVPGIMFASHSSIDGQITWRIQQASLEMVGDHGSAVRSEFLEVDH